MRWFNGNVSSFVPRSFGYTRKHGICKTSLAPSENFLHDIWRTQTPPAWNIVGGSSCLQLAPRIVTRHLFGMSGRGCGKGKVKTREKGWAEMQRETLERKGRGIVFRALEETRSWGARTRRENRPTSHYPVWKTLYSRCARARLHSLLWLGSFDWWNTLVAGVFVHSARLRKNSDDHLFQRLQNKVKNSVQIRLYIR